MRRSPLIVLLLGLAACVPSPSRVETTLGPGARYAAATPDERAAGADRFPVQILGRWGYIDRRGEVAIEPRFDAARAFSEGRAAVRLDGVWGLVDPAGAFVAAPAWAAIGDLADGRARVTVLRDGAERYGYVDADGALVVPPDLVAAYDFAGGLAPARGTRRSTPLGIGILRAVAPASLSPWMLVGTDGRVEAELDAVAVASGARDAAGRLLFPFSRVEGAFQSPTWGWLDSAGREAIAPRFDAVGGFADGLAPAAAGGAFGFVDAGGAFQIAPRFEVALSFSDGLARVRDGGRWGYVRPDGTMAAATEWDGALDASGGRAAVQRDALWGYLGADGALAIPLRYAFATPFRGGLARVRDAAGTAYIDTTGAVVWRGK